MGRRKQGHTPSTGVTAPIARSLSQRPLEARPFEARPFDARPVEVPPSPNRALPVADEISRTIVVARPLVIDPRLLWHLIGVLVTCWFFWQVRDTVLTLVFTAVFTFLGAPVVRLLEQHRVPRAVGAALFLLLAVLLIAALLGLVLPPLIQDLIQLFASLPAAVTSSVEWIEKVSGRQLPTSIQELSSAASRDLLARAASFASQGSAFMGKSALGIFSGALSVAGFLGTVLLIPVLTFFALAELPAVGKLIMQLLPKAPARVARRYVPLIGEALSGLLRGQAIVAGIMAVMNVIGLTISGVPLAVAIGILSGVAYLVPFASVPVCFVLSVAFSAIELRENCLGPIVGTVITCVVVQLVEGYVLTPRIVGERAGLSPLAAILAVLIGGSLLGFIGVVFALPVGAVIAVVYQEETRRRVVVPSREVLG